MEYEKLIKERKTTRLFSKTEVEEEKLNSILEAGRIAPTAKNSQPFRIYVVKSEDGIEKIDKCTMCRYKAPVVLVVLGDKDKCYVKDGRPSYMVDCAIVTTHMMLEAANLGVDSVWVGAFDSQKIITEFMVPENLVPVCLLPLGYKAKLCPPSPFHKIRKNIESIVEYR